MVYTDIGGKPAHHDGQVVVRAAVQGGLVQCPVPVFGPNRLFELVLDVEQPHADRGCQQDDWDLYEQKRADADQPDEGGGQDREGCIGCHGTKPGTPVEELPGGKIVHEKEISRSDAEQYKRVTVKSVGQASPAGARFIAWRKAAADCAGPNSQCACGVSYGI